MQVITVEASMTDLCTKLASVAKPTFFDSVEMASGSTSQVNCKIGNELAMTIVQATGNYGLLNVNMYTLTGSTSVGFEGTWNTIKMIIATDKALVLYDLKNNAPFIIARDTNGNTVAVLCTSTTQTSIINPGGTAGDREIRLYGLLDYGEVSKTYYTNDDTTTRNSYFVPLFVNDDVFVDGVYIALVRPYPNEPGYMPFTIGGTGYVGFGGTSLITEST